MDKKNSNQHRQNQATGQANCWWFKFKFDRWSWGWFLRICSGNNSRRDWRGSLLFSYGGSGSSRFIGTGSGWSGVYNFGNLETSPDDPVVKWLYGAEIPDTCYGVSLPELTQKVHLGKTKQNQKKKRKLSKLEKSNLLTRHSLFSPKTRLLM